MLFLSTGHITSGHTHPFNIKMTNIINASLDVYCQPATDALLAALEMAYLMFMVPNSKYGVFS